MTSKHLTLSWEFERVARIWESDPYERRTLILSGDDQTPQTLSINGVYRVAWTQKGVEHAWKDFEHIDVPCLKQEGWECAIYDNALYQQRSLQVFDSQQKHTLSVPTVPNTFHITPLAWSDAATNWFIQLPPGQWECLEQFSEDGHWRETRFLAIGPLSLIKRMAIYHAFLITSPGYEDKIIFQDFR